MTYKRPKTVVEEVSNILNQRLKQGVYLPGSRLPSESELAKDLQVSRTTVRTALAKFAAEGIVIRKQGDGTFVSKRAGEFGRRYGGQWDFSHVIESNGYKPSIQMLGRELRQASAIEASRLSLNKGNSQVWSIDRLFYASEKAAIHVNNVVPFSLMLDETTPPNGNLHIHQLLENYCGQAVAHAMTDIEAVLWDEAPKLFRDKRMRRPLLKLSEIFYRKDNAALALGTSYYDDSLLRLRLIRS
ncbi:MAG: GntR family transcriptional regulator [Chloroflexota bacterium]